MGKRGLSVRGMSSCGLSSLWMRVRAGKATIGCAGEDAKRRGGMTNDQGGRALRRFGRAVCADGRKVRWGPGCGFDTS